MNPVLLLVAHGSRDPRHAATVRSLAARVRRTRPGLRVETGFLDHCSPGVPQVLDGLAARGQHDIVALPLLLTRAFHAKADIPAVLAGAEARHPRLRIARAGVLGPSPLLQRAPWTGGCGRPGSGPENARPGSSWPRRAPRTRRRSR